MQSGIEEEGQAPGEEGTGRMALRQCIQLCTHQVRSSTKSLPQQSSAQELARPMLGRPGKG